MENKYGVITQGSIFIKDLRFSGYHGVFAEEKKKQRSILLHIKLEVDLSISSETDNLSDTVDTSAVKNIIENIVTKLSFNLIERIAYMVAARILFVFTKVKSVEVTVIKENVIYWQKNGQPGVTICLERKENKND